MPHAQRDAGDMTVPLLWINGGLTCDGDSASLTAPQLPIRSSWSSKAPSPMSRSRRRGYWAGFGNAAPGPGHFTDQPMKTSEWLDRLAPKAVAIVAGGTDATYGGGGYVTRRRC